MVTSVDATVSFEQLIVAITGNHFISWAKSSPPESEPASATVCTAQLVLLANKY
jgi:hypothetical protein